MVRLIQAGQVDPARIAAHTLS